MTNASRVSIRGYNSNSLFLAVIFVIISSLIADVSLSNISDITSVSTSWGFTAFIAITIVYAVGQYFILGFLKSKRIKMKSPYFSKLSIAVIIVQFVLTAIIVFIILQILVSSYYDTYTLILGTSISYVTASILMAILALMFLSWYRSNRSLVFLLYGISSIVVSISIVSSIVFFTAILLRMQEEIHPQPQQHALEEHEEQEEVGHGPDIRKFDPSTTLGIVQIVFTVSRIGSFLLLWGSTTLLLHTYSQKLGKVKFWTIIGIPIASFLSIYIIVTPFVLAFSHNSSTDDTTFVIIIEVLGYTLPAIISSILFGLPFWIISRTLRYGSILKDYMIITASGLVLFGLASSGNVILAPYPPLGLASVSFVGLSSYMILIGIYSSAISISEDEKLRRYIRKTAAEESKLLGSIGFAQMEQQIRKKVTHVIKVQSDNIIENSGVQTSLTEYEIKEYLDEVLQEIKVSKERGK